MKIRKLADEPVWRGMARDRSGPPRAPFDKRVPPPGQVFSRPIGTLHLPRVVAKRA